MQVIAVKYLPPFFEAAVWYHIYNLPNTAVEYRALVAWSEGGVPLLTKAVDIRRGESEYDQNKQKLFHSCLIPPRSTCTTCNACAGARQEFYAMVKMECLFFLMYYSIHFSDDAVKLIREVTDEHWGEDCSIAGQIMTTHTYERHHQISRSFVMGFNVSCSFVSH